MLEVKDIPKCSVKYGSPCIVDYIQNLNEEKHDKLDLDVYLPKYGFNLQRGDVWELFQKQQLILSILQDKLINPLSINWKTDENILEVIDGKQRILSLLQFYNNKFPLVIKDKEYYFKDLCENLQIRIKLFNLTAYYHYEHKNDKSTILTDEQKIEWFLFINNSATIQDFKYLKKLDNLINK